MMHSTIHNLPRLILAGCRESGGYTLFTGTLPKDSGTCGFIVATPDYQDILEIDGLEDYIIEEWIEKYVSLHYDVSTGVGFWLTDGTLFGDVVRWYRHRSTALTAAKSAHQLAYYDIAAHQTIEVTRNAIC